VFVPDFEYQCRYGLGAMLVPFEAVTRELQLV